jgi:hypothetical protein
MNSPTNDERARFEEFAAHNGWSPVRSHAGGYMELITANAWEGWLARSQSAPAAQGEVVMPDGFRIGRGGQWIGALPAYDAEIVAAHRAAGATVELLYTTPQPSAPGVVSDAMVEAALAAANVTFGGGAPDSVWMRAALTAALPAAQPSADDAPRPVGEIVEFGDRGKKHSVHARVDVSLPVGTKLYAGAPPADARDGGLTLESLRVANIARQREWCSNGVMPDLNYRGNELAGECGEACNIVKKLERERLGWPGSRATVAQLAKELGDVVICADLAATAAGINLADGVLASFNDKSREMGHATFLSTDSAMGAGGGK